MFCGYNLSLTGSVLRLTKEHILQTLGGSALDSMHEYRLTNWLGQQEDLHRIVLYQADKRMTVWTKRCIRQVSQKRKTVSTFPISISISKQGYLPRIIKKKTQVQSIYECGGTLQKAGLVKEQPTKRNRILAVPKSAHFCYRSTLTYNFYYCLSPPFRLTVS